MGLKQKYIEEYKYILEQDFVDNLRMFGVTNALKIAYFVDRSEFPSIKNSLITTILGGLVMDSHKQPITFAVEVYKNNQGEVILLDVKEISMDDYLDLMNLNQILKTHENTRTRKGIKKISK